MATWSAFAWAWMLIDKAPVATHFIFPELGSALLLTGGEGWTEGLEKLGVCVSFHSLCCSDVVGRLGGKTVGGTASGV